MEPIYESNQFIDSPVIRLLISLNRNGPFFFSYNLSLGVLAKSWSLNRVTEPFQDGPKEIALELVVVVSYERSWK